MTNPIRIIIADDHLLFIDGLRLLLGQEPSIHVTGIVTDGRELLAMLTAEEHPDLILLDINMPRLNGLEAARKIKLDFPHIRIIILSTYSDEHIIARARKDGINGYLLKNSSKEELLSAIRSVLENKYSFPAIPSKPAYLPGEQDSFTQQFNLTRRELEIISWLKNGLTNQQLADKLFLSVFTIETHRKNIMKKLELKNPAELMKFIYQHNL